MEPLNKSRIIPLSLVYEGEYYEGDITPSAETGKNGMPVYFRVTIGNEFFAYLCCGDTGWTAREQKGNATGLVQAIAAYIRSYYLY
ncbi:MAG TPA: hypothetical protein VFE32_14335 [Puia sp.]|jgi:hypothetical protein|nr:hypothetical protein [Puia sp.]